jgi:hypothetical protein
MNRRTFVKRGVLGGLLLFLGGGTILAALPTLPGAVPTEPLRVLDARAFQVLVAIARRVVTEPGADPVAVAHGVDLALTYVPLEVQGDIGKLLLLFESALSGFVFDRRIKPFTRLDASSQDRVLASWRDSRVALRRTGYQALRKLCLAANYAMPSSWAAVHYPPPTPVGGAYDDSKMGTPEWLRENGIPGPL